MSAFTRRDFVKTSASAVIGLGGLGALAQFGPATADEAKLQPDDVRLSPDIEPLVRLIEETPREKIVAMMIEQLRKGVTYRQFLAAMFLATARMKVSPHHVYMIHSAHQLSLNAGHEERLLPLFWALYTLSHDSAARYPKVNLARTPSPERAASELDVAMREFDSERAEVALLMLGRNQGPRQALSRLWHYAARDYGFIGHLAIAMVNGWRTLETIGWQHAEPIFQFIVRELNEAGEKKPTAYYHVNVERSAKGIQGAPVNWAGGKADEAATRELLALLHKGDQGASIRFAYEALTSGTAQAQAVWDAIFVAASEFMVRFGGPGNIGGRPQHLNTSENALHYAFRTCEDPQTRLYLLLQAVEWAAAFIATEKKRGALRNINILALPDADVPESPAEAVEQIFSRLPHRKQEGKEAHRSEMDKVSQLAFALTQRHSDHRPFLQAASRLTCLKATENPHDVKFPMAIFENYEWVSSKWKPHLLAAAVNRLHGTRMEDNPAVIQAREALRAL